MKKPKDVSRSEEINSDDKLKWLSEIFPYTLDETKKYFSRLGSVGKVEEFYRKTVKYF